MTEQSFDSQGNALPVSNANPVNTEVPEADMIEKAKEIFQRGLDALVNMSRLTGQVTDLQTAVDGLQRDVVKYRNQNDMLDEYLSKARKERDEANNARHAADARVEDLEAGVNSLQSQLDTAKRILGEDQAQVDGLKHERDDALMRSMELEEQVKKLTAKIEKFLSLADEIDPPREPELAKAPVPVAVPNADLPWQQQPQTVTRSW